ncbi:MAG: GNAT family N-acetyltransferase [Chromatiales bacterium]|jgi:ribosomal protein S18 acetylase RimI-like enzyme
MNISRYKPEHEHNVLTAIDRDPDWDLFAKTGTIDSYKNLLMNSVTYVCYDGNEFCGYVRALLDVEFAIYISELYVAPQCRNRKIGRSLLERVKTDYSNLAVYVLSDEDDYYEKIGYKKIGSVFEL